MQAHKGHPEVWPTWATGSLTSLGNPVSFILQAFSLFPQNSRLANVSFHFISIQRARMGKVGRSVNVPRLSPANVEEVNFKTRKETRKQIKVLSTIR